MGPVGFRGYPWVISVDICESFAWVSVEILRYISFYVGFLNVIETDFIDELKKYEEEARYGSNTIDIVICALANIFECTIILLEERDGHYIRNNSLREGLEVTSFSNVQVNIMIPK